MQNKSLLLQTEVNMQKILTRFKDELFSIKTGRASTALVNGIKVKLHDSFVPIRNLATINVTNITTIEIIPWDLSYLNQIEKAILTSGFVPLKANKIIRICISKLTEEGRKELIKKINKIGESFKIMIRNERRAILDNIKKLEKNKLVTRDEKKQYEIDTQKLTEHYINEINKKSNIKEKEILTL
ncbi:MAG: ribosome recycling factor [Endomicrobium sp.]|jgi:ribosome recycling factor|nr:ribosome recycling factor [Endomicrobium sp.]